MPPDFWTNAGVLLATIVAALAGYYGPRMLGNSGAKKVDTVVAGIGMELGNRHQIEDLITAWREMTVQVKRIADILDDKNTEAVRDDIGQLSGQFKTLLTRMAEAEERERREEEERHRRPPRKP